MSPDATPVRYDRGMSLIHPTAVISPESELAEDVQIGPGCVLEGAVKLGAGVRLIASVYLKGPLEIGSGTQVWPFACLGTPPQDFKFGADSITAGAVIGSDCIIREHATVHAATRDDKPTRLGDRVFLMVSSHVGHDATVGDDVILVNNTVLGGHSVVETKATLSGGCMVHQFCRIGRLVFMSGGSGVSSDVPPFCVVSDRQRLGGVNLVGMRRAGMERDEITAVRRAFREVIRKPVTRAEMQAYLDEEGKRWPAVAEMAEFVRTAKRPICPGRGRPPRLGTHSGSAS